MNKKSTLQKIRFVFIIAAIIILVAAICYTAYYLISSKKSKALYDDTVAGFVSARNPNEQSGSGYVHGETAGNGSANVSGGAAGNYDDDSVSGGAAGSDGMGTLSGSDVQENETVTIDWSYCPITVDFKGLQAVNPDIVGWIYCPNTLINYPIVSGEDNSFYLDHNYTGGASKGGAIFADCGNSGDFSDGNTIIYGHHMIDGTMFSGLGKWSNQSYMNMYPYMWLLTPDCTYRIEIFSAYTTTADSEAYRIFSLTDSTREEYISRAIAASGISSAVIPGDEDRLILLSTCAYVFKDARSVVHGRLVPWN